MNYDLGKYSAITNAANLKDRTMYVSKRQTRKDIKSMNNYIKAVVILLPPVFLI